jgi:O-antigen/teichoic acid export membrane protein
MANCSQTTGTHKLSPEDEISDCTLAHANSAVASSPGRLVRAMRGLLSDYTGFALTSVIALVLTPFVLQRTSITAYGAWLTILQISSIIGLLDFGLGMYVVRDVADPRVLSDDLALSRLLSTALFVGTLIALFFLLVGLTLASSVADWLHVPDAERQVVCSTFTLVMLWGGLGILLDILQAIIAGTQRIATARTLQWVTGLLGNLLVFVFMSCGFGLVALPIAYLTSLVLGAIATIHLVRQSVPGFRLRLSLVNRLDLKRLIGYGQYFQMVKIAQVVMTSKDHVILASLLGTAAVTPYAVATKLCVFATGLCLKIPGVVFPSLSEVFSSGQVDLIQQYFLRLSRLFIRLGILAVLLIVTVNERFIDLWLGPELYGGFLLTALLAYSVLRDVFAKGIAVFLYSSGDMRGLGLLSLLEGSLGVALSLFLVREMGIPGVALATAIAGTVTTGWYNAYKICSIINLDLGHYLRQGIVHPTVRSIPATVMALVVGQVTPISWGWAGIAIISAAILASSVLANEVPYVIGDSGVPVADRLRGLIRLSHV